MIVEFLSKMPFLCKTKNPERKAQILVSMFKRELNDADGVFKRSDEDRADPYNRSEPVASLLRCEDVDRARLSQCLRLLHILEWTHYVKEHNDATLQSLLKNTITDASSVEYMYPDIAEVLTVSKAASDGGWNG